MADAYANVVGGSLKLKGKSGKKKRKHVEAEATQKEGEDVVEGAASAAAAEAEAEGTAGASLEARAGMTKAQRDHQRAYERNLKRKSEESKSKTYRERISGLNEYLSNLSEHHDVPRTSKT